MKSHKQHTKLPYFPNPDNSQNLSKTRVPLNFTILVQEEANLKFYPQIHHNYVLGHCIRYQLDNHVLPNDNYNPKMENNYGLHKSVNKQIALIYVHLNLTSSYLIGQFINLNIREEITLFFKSLTSISRIPKRMVQ